MAELYPNRPRWLFWINFIVLQWFGIRLAMVFNIRRSAYTVLYNRVSWGLLRWIWPLTGWWSDYRFIGKPRKQLALTKGRNHE